jgi:hypothetical protein
MYIADTSHRSIRTITPSSFTASSLNINSISVGQIQTASARNGVTGHEPRTIRKVV